MKTVLITGGSGLLGSNIANLIKNRFEVHATYFNNKVGMSGVNFFKGDLLNDGDIEKIKDLNPDIIIHCAALVNVDYCEENPEKAFETNVLGSENIVKVAQQLGAYFIYISTDSVFDGVKGNYKETDETNPINVYGKTKLEAEKRIKSIYPASSIVRINIYGWNKQDKFSLAEWMLNKLENHEELPAFKDVYFTPMFVNDLTEVLMKLIEKKYSGLLHIAGSETISKLEFANCISDVFGLDNEVIKPVSIDEMDFAAPRGKNLSLDVSKAEEVLNISLPGVKDGLEKMKKLKTDYVRGLKHEA